MSTNRVLRVNTARITVGDTAKRANFAAASALESEEALKSGINSLRASLQKAKPLFGETRFDAWVTSTGLAILDIRLDRLSFDLLSDASTSCEDCAALFGSNPASRLGNINRAYALLNEEIALVLRGALDELSQLLGRHDEARSWLKSAEAVRWKRAHGLGDAEIISAIDHHRHFPNNGAIDPLVQLGDIQALLESAKVFFGESMESAFFSLHNRDAAYRAKCIIEAIVCDANFVKDPGSLGIGHHLAKKLNHIARCGDAREAAKELNELAQLPGKTIREKIQNLELLLGAVKSNDAALASTILGIALNAKPNEKEG